MNIIEKQIKKLDAQMDINCFGIYAEYCSHVIYYVIYCSYVMFYVLKYGAIFICFREELLGCGSFTATCKGILKLLVKRFQQLKRFSSVQV